jgi:hypothetical protein
MMTEDVTSNATVSTVGQNKGSQCLLAAKPHTSAMLAACFTLVSFLAYYTSTLKMEEILSSIT